MKIKKVFQRLLIISIGFLFFYPFIASAEVITRRVHLDTETIIRGYTVDLLDNHDFRVGIFPNVFKEESTIKLEKLENSDLENVPEGKNIISDLYLYNITMDKPYVLDDPIVLAVKYESDSIYKKEVHFYNRETSEWQAIPTQIDSENSEARAYIHFPYSKIAVFEDQNYSLSPEKITSNNVNVDGLSAVLVDDKSGKILYEKNANQKLPLASLTKVMTSTIFLEHNPTMSGETTISIYDSAVGAYIGLSSGDIVSNKDLFYATLVGSKNNAAKALARSTGMSTNDFVNRMNNKAKELGMTNTIFAGVTGLNSGNQGSVIDYAKLSIYAYKKLEMLQASTAKSYGFSTLNSDKYLSCANTNKLLYSNLYITGGKTGYLPYDWGGVNYNLMVKAKNNEGNEVVGIIMGNNSPSDIRADMEGMIRWGFENYKWE